MTLSSISPNTASAITPFNPLGKQTVGEEEKDSKNSTLKAVEESAQSAKGSLRQENKDGQDPAIESVLDKDQEQTNNQSEQGKRDDGSQQNEAEQKKAREEKRQQTQEQEEIRQLASRDREVRNHERAHAAVGGQYAGAPSYQFKKGPNGVNYAVSGEVSISTGTINNDPQATIAKAQQIRSAALAPADPSPQDRRVAANATQMESQARQALIQQRREEVTEKEQQKENPEVEAKTQSPQASTPNDERSDNDRKNNKINEETNRRILSINSNYLSYSNHSERLGSIISEAV